VDADRAWDSFREALDADLDDTQHGTTRAGIHLGAMAGTIDVVQRSFAGLRFSGDSILFAPNLPTRLRAVAFEVLYRGHRLRVHLKDGQMSIASAPGDAGPITVHVDGADVVLLPGHTRQFPLPVKAPRAAAS
jgi:trehalose/maltose hydrolase-like predicted phosphorylase